MDARLCLAEVMNVGGLTPVEETALATAYARALDSRSPRSILHDVLADQVVAAIDYDFAGLGVIPSVVCLVALRARMLDDRVRAFVARYPQAVVVDLGAGLDTGVFRVDPPATVDWYSVDLPAMTALRAAVVPDRAGAHSVAASVAKPSWARAIPGDRPTMVIADGLFPFLPDRVVAAVLRDVPAHFRSGIVSFNDYGSVTRLNRLVRRVTTRKRMFRTMYRAWEFTGFRDAHHPETWNAGLRLVEAASSAHEPEVTHFPLMLRVAARCPALAAKARILSYGF